MARNQLGHRVRARCVTRPDPAGVGLAVHREYSLVGCPAGDPPGTDAADGTRREGDEAIRGRIPPQAGRT